MKGLNLISMILLIIGGINWAVLGIVGVNLVATIFAFAPVLTTVIYVLVGIAALYQIMPLTRQLQEGMA
jgi:uncharacterized membrane protein YuzA (DUF378 family)